MKASLCGKRYVNIHDIFSYLHTIFVYMRLWWYEFRNGTWTSNIFDCILIERMRNILYGNYLWMILISYCTIISYVVYGVFVSEIYLTVFRSHYSLRLYIPIWLKWYITPQISSLLDKEEYVIYDHLNSWYFWCMPYHIYCWIWTEVEVTWIW